MISLNKKQQVLIAYNLHGKSRRCIAKELGMSRNTVKKYIEEDEKSRDQDVRNLEVTNNYVTPPTYKKRKSKKIVLTESIIKRIRKMLKENERKRQNNMHKQQLKIVDIHEQLIREGHDISYTTVRNFVNSIEKPKKEVFIRQKATAGYEIEFDWGEVKLFIEHKQRTFSLAVFTLPYSNDRFAYLYESETMVCVQDAHVKCIEYLQFVPEVITYDNMRTVVKNFIGTEREITDGMKHLSMHYQFRIRLCEPRKGNQKGHVERSVEYIRRKAFGPIDSFSSLDEAQKHLIEVLKELNAKPHYLKKIPHVKLLLEERKARGKLQGVAPFDASEILECRVDKYSTVTVRQNHYSVPEGHVGEWVKVKVSAEHIKIFSHGELIAAHKRNWQIHQWIMDIYHYLKTFEKKKGAVAQSECMSQAPQEIKNIYQKHYIGNEKDFLELLTYMHEQQNLKKVIGAISQLERNRMVRVTTEKVIFLAEQGSVSTKVINHKDDVATQSVQNLSTIASLFNIEKTGVAH